MLNIWCWHEVGRRANSLVVVCVKVGADAKQVDFFRGSMSRVEKGENLLILRPTKS